MRVREFHRRISTSTYSYLWAMSHPKLSNQSSMLTNSLKTSSDLKRWKKEMRRQRCLPRVGIKHNALAALTVAVGLRLVKSRRLGYLMRHNLGQKILIASKSKREAKMSISGSLYLVKRFLYEERVNLLL